MDCRKWIDGIVIAAVERVAMLCAAGVVIWWLDDLREMVVSIGTFLMLASFLWGLAWLFIGMAAAIIIPPWECAFKIVLSKLKGDAQ